MDLLRVQGWELRELCRRPLPLPVPHSTKATRTKVFDMILTKQQIEEIEKMLRNGSSFQRSYCINLNFSYLLETVKDLQSREQRARELLEAATEYVRHAPICPAPYQSCDCGLPELFKKIEEHLK